MNSAHFNPACLAEESFTDMCRLVTELAGGKTQALTDFATLYDGGFPGFNWYSRLVFGTLSEEQLPEAASLLSDVRLPLVSFTTQHVPAGLPAVLKKAGYQLRVEQTGMLLDLPVKDEETDPHIVRMERKDMDLWSDTVARAFEKPDDRPAFYLMSEQPDCFFYAWLENGTPVGTTLLYTSHANAGIHEVGVFKEHRRKGIARALVSHALRQAVSDGASVSTLQASPVGKALYATMGYTEVSSIQNWFCPRKLQG